MPVDVSAALESKGVAVLDRYLDISEVRALLQCMRYRSARGEFASARVGGGSMSRHDPDVRGDRTCWLNDPLLADEQALLSRLEQLRLQLNRSLYLALFELEAHYAWYAPGTQYARHVDLPHGAGERRVSLIIYLNEQWDERAGGELEMFGLQEEVLRIAPIAGRLVCFLAAGREHAVRPAMRDRFSVTGWFRARSTESGRAR